MIKIAHFADTHLGYRQYGLIEREEDFYDVFERIIDDMIEKKVDYVIHSGDLFEQPKPPIKALLVAQKGFEKLMENNIPIYVIAGNHDILQRSKTTLPQELYENENFHILSTKNNFHILNNEIFLGGIPYISKSHENVSRELLIKLHKQAEGYKYKILMLHGNIPKYFDFESEFELDTIPSGFDYYAMGHFHERINTKFKEGKLNYPGSTEFRSKKEVEHYNKNKKGYTLVTLDEGTVETELINIPLNREYLIEKIDYPKFDEQLENLKKRILSLIKTNNTNKPILDLTIRYGDFDRSDVTTRIYNKLEDIVLTIRLSYEPSEIETELPENIDKNNLTPRYLIKEKISEEFGEEASSFAVELYDILIQNNLSEAQNLADKFYDELYKKN